MLVDCDAWQEGLRRGPNSISPVATSRVAFHVGLICLERLNRIRLTTCSFISREGLNIDRDWIGPLRFQMNHRDANAMANVKVNNSLH